MNKVERENEKFLNSVEGFYEQFYGEIAGHNGIGKERITILDKNGNCFKVVDISMGINEGIEILIVQK